MSQACRRLYQSHSGFSRLPLVVLKTFISRYLSQRSVMEPNAFYDRYIKEDFENNYVPKAFEEIARQYLITKDITIF
ncbi:MAG TPA: DUF234 domain-containing protein [Oligoflexales bacterium]|nr:DUF234 domain-containing protein [Oligoflexales bacterium]